METHRTVRAFLIAPLVVPLVFLVPLPGADNSGHYSWSLLPAILFYGIYAVPLAYLGELLLGVPAWIIFKHYRIRSFLAFAAGGALLGFVFYLVMETLVGNFARHPAIREFNPFESTYLDFDVLAGLASATLFRVIVYSGQPRKPSA